MKFFNTMFLLLKVALPLFRAIAAETT